MTDDLYPMIEAPRDGTKVVLVRRLFADPALASNPAVWRDGWWHYKNLKGDACAVQDESLRGWKPYLGAVRLDHLSRNDAGRQQRLAELAKRLEIKQRVQQLREQNKAKQTAFNERVIAAYNAGQSNGQIAAAEGTTRGTISGIVGRAGDKITRPKGRGADRIKRQVARQQSAAIDQKLGVTSRFAVVPGPHGTHRVSKVTARDLPEIVEPRAASNCKLTELDDTKCAWPLGDPRDPDFRYCGATVTYKGYCAEHDRAAHNKAPSQGRVNAPFKTSGLRLR